MGRRTLIVVLAVLTLASPAAAHHVPVSTAWKVEQSRPIAEAAWPGSPCAGRLEIHADADARMDADPANDEIHDVGGIHDRGTCVVAVRSTITDPEAFCRVLVHEAGHAAGHEHTDDWTDVMYGGGPRIYAPCDTLAQPVHFRAWVREWVASKSGHAWTCRGDARAQRCIGRPVGSSRRVGVARFVKARGGVIDEDVRYRTTKGPRLVQ